MLMFESWPPQPGGVQWSDRVKDNLSHKHRVFPDVATGHGFAHEDGDLTYMAQLVGNLLISNLPDGSIETAFRIADELTEGWTELSKELFMHQFGYGVGLESADQIEVVPAKAK